MRLTPWAFGRSFALGGGDGKDKLLVGALVAIIVLAVGIGGYALLSGGGDKFEVGQKKDEFGYHCAACNNEWIVSLEDLKSFEASVPPEQWGEHMGMMGNIVPPCPSCQNPRSAQAMTWCPACGKWFYAQVMDPMGGGGLVCTHCGTNIGDWNREHRKKK